MTHITLPTGWNNPIRLNTSRSSIFSPTTNIFSTYFYNHETRGLLECLLGFSFWPLNKKPVREITFPKLYIKIVYVRFSKDEKIHLNVNQPEKKIIRSETAAGVNLRAHPIIMKWAARKIRKSDMVVLQINYICFFKVGSATVFFFTRDSSYTITSFHKYTTFQVTSFNFIITNVITNITKECINSVSVLTENYIALCCIKYAPD